MCNARMQVSSYLSAQDAYIVKWNAFFRPLKKEATYLVFSSFGITNNQLLMLNIDWKKFKRAEYLLSCSFL